MLVLCEVCGNDFNKNPQKQKDGTFAVRCPYCGTINAVVMKKRKKGHYVNYNHH